MLDCPGNQHRTCTCASYIFSIRPAFPKQPVVDPGRSTMVEGSGRKETQMNSV